jgi:K+-sensing histidine kinase KdpD
MKGFDMERILVSMDARRGEWGAWARGISLAVRMDAHVYVLLVVPPEGDAEGKPEPGVSVRQRLELLIELAKSDGVPINYFVAEGNYEEEVILFADNNKIKLIVAEPFEGDLRHTDQEFTSIEKIRHRVRCRMELVSPRKLQNLQV